MPSSPARPCLIKAHLHPRVCSDARAALPPRCPAARSCLAGPAPLSITGTPCCADRRCQSSFWGRVQGSGTLCSPG